MLEALKRSLMQQIQMIDHDLTCLELSIQHATDLQLQSLETLSISIGTLRSTVQAQPECQGPVDSMMRHDLYNNLTVIGGFAQIIMHKRAGHLEADTVIYLNKIVETSKNIQATLQADKAV